MTFKVEQGNTEDGVSVIYKTEEFGELEDACETFFNLKEGQWAIEKDVNQIFLIDPEDEIISKHMFEEND